MDLSHTEGPSGGGGGGGGGGGNPSDVTIQDFLQDHFIGNASPYVYEIFGMAIGQFIGFK